MNSLFRHTSGKAAAVAASFLVTENMISYKSEDRRSSYKSRHLSFFQNGNHASVTSCEAKKEEPIPSSQPGVKLLFLGSGSSTGCPKPICALTFPDRLKDGLTEKDSKFLQTLRDNIGEKCTVSAKANIGDPKRNRNYRNNPSLLISHRNNDAPDRNDSDEQKTDTDDLQNVIIDVGKTFREGALRWMPHHGIHSVDAVVLTHEHADAILGLDDLRGFQIASYMLSKGKSKLSSNSPSDYANLHSNPLPIFLSPLCYETVKKVFSYLVPKEPRKEKNDDKKVVRHVAALNFQTVSFFEPFYAAGLKMIPLPVKHGEDLICNGYAFSVKSDDKKKKATNVVYLSDISRMIPETEKFILEQLQPTDVLVIDSLLVDRAHPVHFSLDQAIELASKLKAKQTYIVGINCDDFPEHDVANELIRKKNPNVQLAYDGLAIEI
ncbi:hypothetical protein CTEN210_10103 [Chaetoceros tenuissimus]|uniref:Metallo-beta-lactamase domain-containing protein n=1 Tax=Chaetoceros tenuissimus TaxID=426638 RepID=A0AAD3H7M8_9STRA|nr:hypothetical protein CTEN210_10103 [Chaetoceros tenuissimus]